MLSGVSAPSAADDPIALCSGDSAPEAAIEACSRLIASGRMAGAELGKALFWRGYAHDRQGATDSAIADYSEAIRLDPTTAAAYEGRARILTETGHRDRAIADWSEIVRLDPNNLTAHINRGVLRFFTGDLDHAIED